MKRITLTCRRGVGGRGEGEALVSREPISFYADIDPETGKVVSKLTLPELYGKSVVRRVLVFPTGKGGTFSTWVMIDMAERGLAPAAMINVKAHPVFAYGAEIAKIAYVDRLDSDLLKTIETGDYVVVDAEKGTVEVTKR
jgi:predicted aconitase with swiveling domain